MTEQIPLSELKAGDEVILRNGGYLNSDTIEIIERTTKHWIILSKGRKFRISDGYPVGKRDCRWFSISSIKSATPELKEKIKREQALLKARNTVWSLAEEVKKRGSRSNNAAAVIPHLQAALAALEADQSNEQS